MPKQSDAPPRRAVFDEITADYLKQVGEVWHKAPFASLGCEEREGKVMVPYLGREYLVSPEGIIGPGGHAPGHATGVVLCKYLLMDGSPDFPEGDWMAYKEYKDAAPYAEGYANTVERRLAKAFGGRLDDLRADVELYGGREIVSDLSYDLVRYFRALPRVPLLMLFNDEDSPFPAQCSVLCKRNAHVFLDMECLAMVGIVLAGLLCRGGREDEARLL